MDRRLSQGATEKFAQAKAGGYRINWQPHPSGCVEAIRASAFPNADASKSFGVQETLKTSHLPLSSKGIKKA